MTKEEEATREILVHLDEVTELVEFLNKQKVLDSEGYARTRFAAEFLF